MVIFKDKLYVSTGLNYDHGAQVWYTADGDTWEVTVSNNIWLQEMILYKHKIRAKYRKKYGLDIQDIIFFVKT